jgi:Rad3-related DNA helicase
MLRDYQQDQMDFVEDHLPYTNVVGVESPTGSGKTFVIIEIAKRWLEEHPLSNVVISTGFNNLVFDMEKRALQMGVKNVKVLIGTNALNCPVLMKDAGLEWKPFTVDGYRCGKDHYDSRGVCPDTLAAYHSYYNGLISGAGQLVITNHSSLLVHQQKLSNVSLVIVDEAHTFANFYESFLRLEITSKELEKVDEAVHRLPQPLSNIVEMNIRNNAPLPLKQVDRLVAGIDDISLRRRVEEFFSTRNSYNNWVERGRDGYSVDTFYREFDLQMDAKLVLFSATLDGFTNQMFNLKKVHTYRESKRFCDYTKSEFVAVLEDDFLVALKRFLDHVKDSDAGLVLSTTISDMKLALTMDGYLGYKMFTDRMEFLKHHGRKILVGSRGLFQGIDIDGLKFVCLNRIPFPNWGEKEQARARFLTQNGKNGFDPWNQFTIPKTENDIIQSTGRLWRNSQSRGVIGICDTRLEKFRYIVKHAVAEARPGISIMKLEADGSVNPFNIKGQ